MRIFRIPSGKHRARPLRLGIWWNQKTFSWKVKFTESCRYDLKSDDQFDTNKLFGIGYIPGFHHKDSARFGWRYWPDKGSIELSAYCYVNKQRVIQHIGFCEIGKIYSLALGKLANSYLFACYEEVGMSTSKSNGSAEVPYTHDKKLGYRLGIFFGGNQPAPHVIKIELEKL